MKEFYQKNHYFRFYILLLTIAILGLLARVVLIDKVSPRLTVDEASIGYNAYSILSTGKDEWGIPFPLMFRAFGDYKLPAYIYATVPMVWLFGLNFFSVRLISIVSGVSVIFAVGILGKILNKPTAGLIGALVVAFSPWGIFLSRGAFESNFALAFWSWGIVSLLYAYQTKKKLFWFLSALFFAITLYSYIAYRLIVVLFLLSTLILIFFTKTEMTMKKTFIFLAIFAVFCLPLASNIFSTGGLARFQQISLFTNEGIKMEIDEQRSFCYLSNKNILPKICPLVFNKVTLLTSRFANQYLSFFFPQFLFIDAKQPFYLGLEKWGTLLLVFMPFYYLGLFCLLKGKDFASRILQFALFLAPIPSTLTGEAQIVRVSALLFINAFVIGLGWEYLWQKISQKSWRLVLAVSCSALFIFNISRFALEYYFIFPIKEDSASSSIPSRLLEDLQKLEKNYDLIYVNDHFSDFYIYLAFYNKMDPEFVQKNVVRPTGDKLGFTHPIQLGKFYFSPMKVDEVFCSNQDKKVLYITHPGESLTTKQKYYNASNVHLQAHMVDSETFWIDGMEKCKR